MTLMKVAKRANFTLVYDTNDVENCTVSTPYDVHDVSPGADGGIRRELGQAHLTLHIDFKPGKRPLWVEGTEGSE